MPLELAAQRADVDAGALEQATDQAVVLVEEAEQQLLDADLGVAVAQRDRLRIVQRLLGVLREPVRS
jgi:hypothetical protein